MENTTLAFIGMWEAVIIMVAILIFFGAKKLPELAAGLGKGIREFKRASSDFGDEIHRPYTPPQHNNSEDGFHQSGVKVQK